MSPVAIRLERLGKRYRLGQLRSYKTIRDMMAGAITGPFRAGAAVFRGREAEKREVSSDHFIWALKDTSFDIGRGEVVGVIGRNGAGKSTLLKILSRIIEPTEGCAVIHGRVGSLLEVGTGFHPELTGRENIFLNGAILGMKREEIKRKFDDIIGFAEVEEFLDTPVKHYSSGMHVRLAFSVAAHLEPENLFVDEVLAVGDAAFQRRCLGKMGEVARGGRTVLFVSHNMGSIRSLCDRVIWIDQGRVVLDGDSSQVISAYLASTISGSSHGEVAWPDVDDAPGGEEVKLRGIRLLGEEGSPSSLFEVDKPIRMEIRYEVRRAVRGMRIRMGLLTLQGEIAFQSTDHRVREAEVEPGHYRSICTIPGGLLNIGQYLVKVGAGIPGLKVLIPHREYLRFETAGPGNQGSDFSERWPGVVCPKLDWVIERIE